MAKVKDILFPIQIKVNQKELYITKQSFSLSKNGFFITKSENKLIGDISVNLSITASIDPKNTDSIRMVERLGFKKKAHFRESLFIRGEWVDDAVYAILEKDLVKE